MNEAAGPLVSEMRPGEMPASALTLYKGDGVRDGDYQACVLMLRNGSKSFFAASRLLPERMRVPTAALYAFCRVADDEVDLAPATGGTKRDAERRAVDHLRKKLHAVYTGTPRDNPVDRLFHAVVTLYQIPKTLPDALLDGMQWDADGHDYHTYSDVVAYAARVASSVGVMMTMLMGQRDPLVLARAADLGVAMQLTNIARDVGEDARMGRVYLPHEWLHDAGIDREAWLKEPTFTPPLGQVVKRLLGEAQTLYARSETGLSSLPKDCRTAIYGARLIYSAIGDVIERRGYDSVNSRASTTGLKKVWLLARAFFASRLAFPELVRRPPLPEVAFLVEPVSSPLLAVATHDPVEVA